MFNSLTNYNCTWENKNLQQTDVHSTCYIFSLYILFCEIQEVRNMHSLVSKYFSTFLGFFFPQVKLSFSVTYLIWTCPFSPSLFTVDPYHSLCCWSPWPPDFLPCVPYTFPPLPPSSHHASPPPPPLSPSKSCPFFSSYLRFCTIGFLLWSTMFYLSSKFTVITFNCIFFDFKVKHIYTEMHKP